MLKKLLKNKLALVGIAILLIGLPIVIWQTQRSQDVRQRAQTVPATIDFHFNPDNGTFLKGNTFSVDLMMDTGSYDVGSVTLELRYGGTRLLLANITSDNYAINDSDPSGGVYNVILLNSGSTPITGENIKVVTFEFRANESGVANIALNPNIKATATGIDNYLLLSAETIAGVSGQYNITDPNISPPPPSLTPDPTAAATPTATTAPTATLTPASTPTNTPVPTATPTLPPGSTSLTFSVSLPGIGDNEITEGPGSTSNNETPEHPTRDVEILLEASDGTDVTSLATSNNESIKGTVIFDPITFTYKGTVDLGDTPTDNYIIKVRLDNTLYEEYIGFPVITNGQENTLSQTIRLIPGDIDRSGIEDNETNLNDYILFIACYQGKPICTADDRDRSDLNDNGIMTQIELEASDIIGGERDIDILLKSLSETKGD